MKKIILILTLLVVSVSHAQVDKSKYDYVVIFPEYDSIAIVYKDKKWGLTDKKGKATTPLQYDTISYFYLGYAQVEINNQYALINTQGKEVTPTRYDHIDGFIQPYNIAKVRKGYEWGFINEKGEQITPIKYHLIDGHTDGYFSVQTDGKYGIINVEGK